VLSIARSLPAVTRANRSFSVSFVDPTTASSSSASCVPSVPNFEGPHTGTIADRRANAGLLVAKNRSSSNLVSHASSGANARADAQSQRGRMSVDSSIDYDLTRCVQNVESRIGKQSRDGLRRLCTANKPASGLRMTAGTGLHETIADVHICDKQITHPDCREGHWFAPHKDCTRSLRTKSPSFRISIGFFFCRKLTEGFTYSGCCTRISCNPIRRRFDSISIRVIAFILVRTSK
jgi:hypothetical protein